MNVTRKTIVFLNGKFVPESEAVISVFDRGFLYGDGLFETIRVLHGRPFRWTRHMLRLQRGLNHLRIALPLSDSDIRASAMELIRANETPDCLLRVSISRGVGPRGYSPRGATQPTITMTVHPTSPVDGIPQWKLVTASLRLRSDDPLAHFKSANKLVQVLARAEAEEAGCDEALLLNDHGDAVETAGGNLFWIANGEVCTAPLGTGILPGITRSVIFEVCETLGHRVQEQNAGLDELLTSDGAFVSVTSFGVVQIAAVDSVPMKTSSLAPIIATEYLRLLDRETSQNS